jgi:hypothetical protein
VQNTNVCITIGATPPQRHHDDHHTPAFSGC